MIENNLSRRLPAPTPIVRGLLALVALIATFSTGSVAVLFAAWLLVLLPLVLGTGIQKEHLRFVLFVALPLSLLLVAVWGWLVGAPPGQPLGSDPAGGVAYAARIATRLISVAAIFQLCFLPLSKEERLVLLRSWGMPASVATAIIAAFALLPEMRRRAQQISTAYRARGLASRPWYSQAIGISTLLAPLVTWSLRSAHQREEVAWGQRPILKNFQALALQHGAARLRTRDAVYLSLGGLYWALMVLGTQWHN